MDELSNNTNKTATERFGILLLGSRARFAEMTITKINYSKYGTHHTTHSARGLS